MTSRTHLEVSEKKEETRYGRIIKQGGEGKGEEGDRDARALGITIQEAARLSPRLVLVMPRIQTTELMKRVYGGQSRPRCLYVAGFFLILLKKNTLCCVWVFIKRRKGNRKSHW